MMFLLRCPSCKNEMKYETRQLTLTKQLKECVYCGKSFKARDNIRERIA